MSLFLCHPEGTPAPMLWPHFIPWGEKTLGLCSFLQLLLPKDVGLDIGPCRPSASPLMWSLLPSGTGCAGSDLRRSLYICVAPSEQGEEIRNFHTYKFICIPILKFLFIFRSIAKQRDCSSCLVFFFLSYQTVMLNNKDEIALEHSAGVSVSCKTHTFLFFFPFSLACPPMRFFFPPFTSVPFFSVSLQPV